MSSNALNKIIELIRAGDKATAQELLKVLVDSEPHNVAAWLWYADTFKTAQERLAVLQKCLARNPENPQAKKAVSTLQSRLPTEERTAAPAQTDLNPAPLSPPLNASNPYMPQPMPSAASQTQRGPTPLAAPSIRSTGSIRKQSGIPLSVPLLGLLVLFIGVAVFIVYPALVRQYFIDLDLETLLIRKGELPAGLSAGQYKVYTQGEIDGSESDHESWMRPVKIVEQRVTDPGMERGEVLVRLFDNPAALDALAVDYNKISDLPSTIGDNGFVDVPSPDKIGDRRYVYPMRQSSGEVDYIYTFFRCKAIVDIEFTFIPDLEQIKAYARRLDARLSPLVCR